MSILYYHTVCNYNTVPTPNVTVTAPNTQTVGQSLTLECSVTTVRGITSRVDIIWSSDDTELERMEGVNVSSTTDNSVVYTDTYNILQLSTNDDGREYHCEVVINTSPPVMANDSVALKLTGQCVLFNVPLLCIHFLHSFSSYSYHITIWSNTRSYGE